MCDPFWGITLGAGLADFSDMCWSETFFEENEITEVEEIEMLIRVYDSEDWLADDIYSETVTLNP